MIRHELGVALLAAVLLACQGGPEAAAAACLEIAYSSALKVDTPGVPLRVPPAAPETLHVDLVGP